MIPSPNSFHVKVVCIKNENGIVLNVQMDRYLIKLVALRRKQERSSAGRVGTMPIV